MYKAHNCPKCGTELSIERYDVWGRSDEEFTCWVCGGESSSCKCWIFRLRCLKCRRLVGGYTRTPRWGTDEFNEELRWKQKLPVGEKEGDIPMLETDLEWANGILASLGLPVRPALYWSLRVRQNLEVEAIIVNEQGVDIAGAVIARKIDQLYFSNLKFQASKGCFLKFHASEGLLPEAEFHAVEAKDIEAAPDPQSP